MAVRAQSVLTARIVDYDEADDITQYFPYNRTDRPPHTCPAYMTGHIAAPASRENTDRSRPGPRSGRSSHRSRPCYSHCRRCRRDRAGGSALRSSRACRYTDQSTGDAFITIIILWYYVFTRFARCLQNKTFTIMISELMGGRGGNGQKVYFPL